MVQIIPFCFYVDDNNKKIIYSIFVAQSAKMIRVK